MQNPVLTLSLALFTLLTASAQASPVLSVSGRRFLDSQGRQVLLRGVNVAADAKSKPFIPFSTTPAGDADLSKLDALPGWGINVIRLLFLWEAYEPRPGEFDEAYLAGVTRVADAAWARGIYVVLDMHQDDFSRYLGNECGDGFPAWAVPVRFRRESAGPAHSCGALWAVPMTLSSALHRSYSSFYANEDGVRSAFLALWKRLARHFSTHPGVVGYDLLNEPSGHERTELAPLYADAAAAVKTEDPTAIFWVEPAVTTTIGLTRSHLPKPAFGPVVFSPHYYNPVTVMTNSWGEVLGPLTAAAYRRMEEVAREWDAPLFAGEFGVQGKASGAARFVDFQYGRLNEYLASATQWNYTPAWTPAARDGWNGEDLSIVDDRGQLRKNFRARPSAQKVQGLILSQTEKRDRQGTLLRFELRWQDPGTAGETEIFVPEALLSDPETYAWRTRGGSLTCTPAADSRSAIRCRASAPGVKSFQIEKVSTR